MSDSTQIGGTAKVPGEVNGNYVTNINNAYVTGTDQFTVDTGGTATNISATGGGFGYVYGGTASNWTASNSGYIAVDSGATLSGLTVDGGYVDVNNGAIVDTATVSNPSNLNGEGYLIINSGTVNDGVATSGGMIDAKGINATATNVSASSGGKLLAEQGTIISGTVGSGGNFTLNGSPASATNTVVNGGELDVNGGAQVTTTTVDSGGKISAAGVMSNTTVNDGTVTVLGGGTADTTTVNSTGEFYVLSNATATDTTVGVGGDVSAWGGVTNTTLNDGKLTVLGGGSADTTTVSGTSASLYVDSNASAYNNTINGGSVFVEGLVSGGTLTDGGQIRVSAGGVISSINTQDGSLFISAGGSAYDTNVVSGFTQVDGYISGGSIYDGKITVNSGGVASGVFASGTDFDTQGTIEVNGGTVTDAITHDYGNVTLYTGTVNNLSATGGGITMSGGTLNGGTFQSGATMTVVDGAVTGDIVIGNGGHANVSGGTVSELNIESGGSGAITGGSVADTTISSGGQINFNSSATLTDTLTLSSGGTASITGNTSGTVKLEEGYTSGLTITGIDISKDETVTTKISGWTKDSQIDLQYVTFDSATWAYSDADHVKITLQNGSTVTLNIPNVETIGFNILNDGQGGTIITCFLSGSMIRTSEGDVAVEDIQIGDEVIAFDWKNNMDVTRSIVWVGKAHVNVCHGLPDDEAGWPVRILKDAIADGVPYKDMLITSEHCLFFKGRFVPVRMLVNGVSIFYDKSISSYDYYHIETEQHSVITADGMLTESYLDTGNRSSFRQEGKVAALRGAVKNWEDDAGAPLGVDRSFVEPLFRALEWREDKVLAEQAHAAPELTSDPDLHLVTETGAVVRPMRKTAHQYSFMLPPDTRSVRIVSRASRPSDVIGPFVDDRRFMGVAIANVRLLCAKKPFDITSHLQTEKPEGWHADMGWEGVAWTNGNAELPLGDHLAHGKMGILSMTVCAAGPYIKDNQKAPKMAKSA